MRAAYSQPVQRCYTIYEQLTKPILLFSIRLRGINATPVDDAESACFISGQALQLLQRILLFYTLFSVT